MEKVIEIKGEKYHLIHKSFIGWLKHIKSYRSRHKSFDDWFSEFIWVGRDKFKGSESILIFSTRRMKFFYHYFEKGFSPEEAMIEYINKLTDK